MQIPSEPEIMPPPEKGEEFIFFVVQLMNPAFDTKQEAQFGIRLDAMSGNMKDIYFLGVRKVFQHGPNLPDLSGPRPPSPRIPKNPDSPRKNGPILPRKKRNEYFE
jgi:hypothetical protein